MIQYIDAAEDALDQMLQSLTAPGGAWAPSSWVSYRRARNAEDLGSQPHRVYLMRTGQIDPGGLQPRLTYLATLDLYLQPTGDAVHDDRQLRREAVHLMEAIRVREQWPTGTTSVTADGAQLDVDEATGSLVAQLSIRIEVMRVG